MDSANLPFSVHYKEAAKSGQGMQQKFSVLRSLAASQRHYVTCVQKCIYVCRYRCVYMHTHAHIHIYKYISMLEREVGGRERKRARKTSPFQKNYDLQKPNNLLWFVALLLDFLCIEVKKSNPKHIDT